MGPGDESQRGASGSGSLRTRSHSRADPLWTVQDMLILVNEIAVVEGECQNALSSYQKWSMIAENCTALDVVRNMTQCRRKWESLQAEYKLVKEWEAILRKDSYWSLSIQERKEIGLPLDFDRELFEAMGNFTKLQDQADTDPEDDPEAAEIDVVDAEESGPKPKRVKRRSTPQNKVLGERKQPVVEEEPEKAVPTYWSTPQEKVTGERKHVLEDELENPVLTRQSTPQKKVNGERKQPVLEEVLEKPEPAVEEKEQIPTDCQPKRLRNRSTPRKGVISEEKKQPMLEEESEEPIPIVEQMEQVHEEPKPKRVRHRSNPRKGVISEEKKQPMPEEESEEPIPVVEQMEQVHEEPKPKRARRRSNPKKLLSREKKQSKRDPHVEEMEQTLAEKLKENTELIHAIVAGNLTETQGDEMRDQEDEDTLKIERVRSKADKLVSCLRDLAKNLEQLCGVEGC